MKNEGFSVVKEELDSSVKTQKFLTADEAQSMASHPQYSAWVSASAGTGKTKVLTDRVLRLLLPREKGEKGSPARSIVCLTFTKAAANEMAVRITKMLGAWAVMADGALVTKLEILLGYAPSDEHIAAARRLFAEVVDMPGGLQIMTIHAFCQSVLGRFPLESGVSPDFMVLDEAKASVLMKRAQDYVIEKAQTPEYAGSPLSNALHNLTVLLSPDLFLSQIAGIAKERHQLAEILVRNNGVLGVYAKLCGLYSIPPDMTEEALLKEFCADSCFDKGGLKEAGEILLAAKGKKANVRAEIMLAWLGASCEKRAEDFLTYKQAYLTRKDTVHKLAFPPSAVNKKHPHIADILYKEAERVLACLDKIKSVQSAFVTRDLLYVAQEIIERYEILKEQQGSLDYDDLINRTMGLLNGQNCALQKAFSKMRTLKSVEVLPWVLYKLDQGIDHILIDEAQDTNPEQWKIIESLSDEFFAGQGAKENVTRTSFTVGDIKQSIYGFQRAAPDEFKRMERVFDTKIKHAGQVNNIVPLDVSFRSSESVLRLVDRVFKKEPSLQALGESHIHHRVHRKGQAGLVELWPIFETEASEKDEPWAPATEVKVQSSGVENLARFIAKKIRNMLLRKEIISSYGRPIQPGDIMVLVRSRGAIVKHLIRALKAEGVPVSGADRMIVSEQLVVQDLIALGRFCLLPEDDLTLAEVLKSPLIGITEEDLFSFSYGRKGSLWSEICAPNETRLSAFGGDINLPNREKISEIHRYLSRMIGRACRLNSYEFFSSILNESCPADSYSGMRAICRRLSEEAFDPLEEFMTMALNFTHEHTDHLQSFIEQHEKTRTEVKREMEALDNKVRIMTIHGSKGLQAPIVILPDTMHKKSGQNRDHVLWPAKTGVDVPLYAANADMMPEVYVSYKMQKEQKEEEELQRLLYVAMTRAADRLYIGAYTGTKKPPEGSWYEQIRDAMETDEIVQHIQMPEGEGLQIKNEQSALPDKEQEEEVLQKEVPDIATWVYANPKAEPVPPKPLMPSRPSEEEDNQERALSPLKGHAEKRFLRGNITHTLLQFLPDYAPEKYEDIAFRYIEKNAAELSQHVRENIVQEVCSILTNPDFAPFFGAGSMAEVPVTALMADNRIVSGQIDRLLVGEKDIWILDYKTNRPPPRDAKDIPQIYRDQLKAYRDAVQKIYPSHDIHSALLWTDGPYLMKVSL